MDFKPIFSDSLVVRENNECINLSNDLPSYLYFCKEKKLIAKLLIEGRSVAEVIDYYVEKKLDISIKNILDVLLDLAIKGFIKNREDFFKYLEIDKSKTVKFKPSKQVKLGFPVLKNFYEEILLIFLLIPFVLAGVKIFGNKVNPLVVDNSYYKGFLISILTVSAVYFAKQILVAILISGLGGRVFFKGISLNYEEGKFLGYHSYRRISLVGLYVYIVFFLILFTLYTAYNGKLFISAVWWAGFMVFMDFSIFVKTDFFRWAESLLKEEPIKAMEEYWRTKFMKNITKVNDQIERKEQSIILLLSYSILWLVAFFTLLNHLLLTSWFSGVYNLSNLSLLDLIFYFIWGFVILGFIVSTVIFSVYLIIISLKPDGIYDKLFGKNDKNVISKENLKKLSFYSSLDDEKLDKIIKYLTVVNFYKGQKIINEGDIGENFYTIFKGRVKVVKKENGEEKLLAKLYEGASFGEIALIKNVPRTATVIADTDCTVITLNKKDFERFSLDNKERKNELLKRIAFEQVVSKITFFKNIDWKQREKFYLSGKEIIFEDGDKIIEEGEEGDTFFVIISGKVKVIKNGKVVAELSDGDYFGEIALLKNIKRTADVVSVGETKVFVLNRDNFYQIIKENIKSGYEIDKTLIKRVNN